MTICNDDIDPPCTHYPIKQFSSHFDIDKASLKILLVFYLQRKIQHSFEFELKLRDVWIPTDPPGEISACLEVPPLPLNFSLGKIQGQSRGIKGLPENVCFPIKTWFFSLNHKIAEQGSTKEVAWVQPLAMNV